MSQMSFLIVSILACIICSVNGNVRRSFGIDFANNQFVKDGQSYRYISGSIQYFRIPKKYWKDRLLKLKAIGCNAVQTYITWFQHQPTPDHYDFEGSKDVIEFLRISQSLDLDVILRLGPYIDGLLDMGGLPGWLLRDEDIRLRQWDDKFLAQVAVWYDKILPMLRPYLHPNGGPVIMAQIENEYGSYPACDHNYTKWLLDKAVEHLGNDIVYFTDDGPSKRQLGCGHIKGAYSTVDFGPVASARYVSQNFDRQRLFAPRGPLVNTEFYPGWHTMWGDKFQTLNVKPSFLRTMRDMYALNASFSIYVIHGGTNFGFSSGSEQLGTGPFKSTTTSYDWDAPVREDGSLRPKYFQIKKQIQQLTGRKSHVKVPAPIERTAYGGIEMKPIGNIFELLLNLTVDEPKRLRYPINVEALGHYYGYTLYETQLHTGKGILNVTKAIHDRGYFIVDRELLVGRTQRMGVREEHDQLISLDGRKGQPTRLSILVDNQGRIHYSERLKDFKGIVRNITLDGQILTDWTVYRLDISNFIQKLHPHLQCKTHSHGKKWLPQILAGQFRAARVGDTWIDTTNWGKGNLYVDDGFNLGRYWPTRGPQMTLYHPFIRSGLNNLFAFELERMGNCFHRRCYMQSVLNPINSIPYDV